MKNPIDTFHTAPFNHNYAQAIDYCHPEANLDIDGLRAYGGGRAPGGLCGALYAATLIRPDKKDEIIARFRELNGATCCRDLKGPARVGCHQCLTTAQQILSE